MNNTEEQKEATINYNFILLSEIIGDLMNRINRQQKQIDALYGIMNKEGQRIFELGKAVFPARSDEEEIRKFWEESEDMK